MEPTPNDVRPTAGPAARRRIGTLAVAVLLLGLAACGDDTTDTTDTAATTDTAQTSGAAKVAAGSPGADAASRLVDADEAAALLESPPAGLVLLDVRTPEEFAAGHLEGAVLVDYNAGDFRARLDGLDRTVPYLVYCRSGNRSAGAVAAMEELGFASITELDGGIQAWSAAGLTVVTG